MLGLEFERDRHSCGGQLDAAHLDDQRALVGFGQRAVAVEHEVGQVQRPGGHVVYRQAILCLERDRCPRRCSPGGCWHGSSLWHGAIPRC